MARRQHDELLLPAGEESIGADNEGANALYRNLGNWRFEDITARAGVALTGRRSTGAVLADVDRDGDLDLLVSTNHGPAYLLRNDGGNRNHWLSVKAVGTKSNRSALGAVVRIESPSGRQWSTVRSGSSYCSQSDLALTFGLGKDTVVSTLEIEWPSGARDRLSGIRADQLLVVEEGRGR